VKSSKAMAQKGLFLPMMMEEEEDDEKIHMHKR
jgi:hypothetical protein